MVNRRRRPFGKLRAGSEQGRRINPDEPSPAFGRNQDQLTRRHEEHKGRSYLRAPCFVTLVALCENNSLHSSGLRRSSEMIWK